MEGGIASELEEHVEGGMSDTRAQKKSRLIAGDVSDTVTGNDADHHDGVDIGRGRGRGRGRGTRRGRGRDSGRYRG